MRFVVIVFLTLMSGFNSMNISAKDMIIDDRSTGSTFSNMGSEWRLLTDQVMGGVSEGSLVLDNYLGRDCMKMKGQVSTRNNGGFVQIALDIIKNKTFNASAFEGILLDVSGNNEQYNLHIRTSDLWFPWQSYRASFIATDEWKTIKIPFSQLTPYRTTQTFRKNEIKRIGVVAIGRQFNADLCIASVTFYGVKSDEK